MVWHGPRGTNHRRRRVDFLVHADVAEVAEVTADPSTDLPDGRLPDGRRRPWRTVLMMALSIGGVGLLALVGRRMLTGSVATFAHLDWVWLPLAVIAELGSMAAFARVQRRLLRVGGTPLHLGSVMAVTYAGNAISVSLPLAGSEVATAFTFRQYHRRGIDPAVAGWALAVSGIVSSFAFAILLAGGAVASGNTTFAALGLAGAVVSLLPTVGVLAANRYPAVRRRLNRLLARLVSISRRLLKRPAPGAEDALERFLDRVASLRLPRMQYAEVIALALWNWVADCFCLAAAIRATGNPVPWQGLFLAYSVAMTAGSIGLTPGGLGVIEATLAASLAAAGIAGRHALAAVLVYRFISFWAVMAGGWAVMVLLTRRRQPVLATSPD
jgi:uncharacterized protein (TIRG00374 family)